MTNRDEGPPPHGGGPVIARAPLLLPDWTMPKRLLPALAVPLALLAGTPAARAATDAATPDPLDRPARISPLAAHALLTSVTRAGTRLVAVGERGHILLSDDDGMSWRQAAAPTSVTLTTVRFADATTGWAVGHEGVVLRTLDGGTSWTRRLDGRTAAALVVRATPAHDGRARAEAERLVQDGPDKPFFDLLVRGPRDVLVVGAYGLAFETRDGGESWSPALDRIPNPGRSHIYALQPVGDTVYAAGEQGLLARSADGGEHFELLDSPYVGSFFGLAVAPGGAVLALGLRGNLYRTDDRGATWTKVDLGSQYSLTGGMSLRDGAALLVDEAGTVWLSTDRGRSFQPRLDSAGFPLLGTVELRDGEVLAVGARGTARLTISTRAR